MSDIDRLLTLDAGGELDAGIGQMLGIPAEYGARKWIDGDWRYVYIRDDTMAGGYRTALEYSSDLNAALTLLPAPMPTFAFSLYLDGGYKDGTVWEAWLGMGQSHKCDGLADTPALAVCRAWLLAVQTGIITVK